MRVPTGLLIVALIVSAGSRATGYEEDRRTAVVIILSQAGSVHSRRASEKKAEVLRQASNLQPPHDDAIVDVLCLHDEWKDMLGGWTILPIIPDLYEKYGNADWIIFIGEKTNVNLWRLFGALAGYDHRKNLFLGRALRDTRPAIIHHFAFAENPSSFAYPDFESGFIFSNSLLKVLGSSRIHLMTDFSIDAQHELAMFVWNKGLGSELTHMPVLCASPKAAPSAVDSATACATSYDAKIPHCTENEISADDVFVMVKTCEKYHKERVPVVKELWGDTVKHIEYCSEKADETIPTIALGVKNTERGHCAKLLAILQRAAAQPRIKSKKWLVVADDDSLLNFGRMVKLLSCYPSSVATALGERYGYDVRGGERSHGYDYITGGGSMVLSMAGVRALLERGVRCPSADSPDDMMLGIWLSSAGIPITHSRLFHQARPDEYSPEYLDYQESISFHKFDDAAQARAIYERWLADPVVGGGMPGHSRRAQRGGEL